MDFSEVLTRAWKIIWKHKALWLFGILAGCGQGGGANTGYQFSSGEQPVSPGMEQFSENIQQFVDQIQAWQVVAIVFIVLLLCLAVWFILLSLSTIGSIGLVQGAARADKSEERLSFGELFSSGKPFFWRVFGLTLVTSLGLLILFLLLVLPLIGVSVLTMGIGLICVLPLICLSVPFVWAINLLIKQATIAVVLEDLGILEGLQRGWEVFRQNLGNIIVMGLILGFGGVVIGFLLAIPLLLVMLPAGFGILLGGLTRSEVALSGGLVVAGLCFLGYLPVLVLLNGILRAYIESAWTLTYLRLTKPGIEAVLVSPPVEA